MQKYANSVQDTAGNAIEAASVYVYDQGTINLSTIYSDNGSTVTTNPQTTNSLGEFSFYAADGRYDIKVSKTGITTQNLLDIILFDPAASTGAAGVGFLQSGTGTVATNLQDYLRLNKIVHGWIPTSLWAGISDGTGTTDLITYIQAAIDDINTAGGGTLFFPRGYYLIKNPMLIKDYVGVVGSGFGSHIENTNTSAGTDYGPCIFMFGLYSAATGAQIQDETFYAINNAARDAISVTTTTASDAGNFAAGDIVFIRNSTEYADSSHSSNIPFDSEMNEVISAVAGTGVITLKYPLTETFSTSATIAKSSGTLLNGSDPVKIIKGAEFGNFRITQKATAVRGVSSFGGAFECYVHDLLVDSCSNFFSCNAFARSAIERVRGICSNISLEFAYWSHNSYAKDVNFSRITGYPSTLSRMMQFAERVRDCDYIDCFSDGGAIDSGVALVANTKRCRIRGGRIRAISCTSTNYPIVMSRSPFDATSAGPVDNVVDGVIIEANAPTHIIDINTADVTGLAAAYRGIGNTVRNCLITGAPTGAAIFFDNYTQDEKTQGNTIRITSSSAAIQCNTNTTANKLLDDDCGSNGITLTNNTNFARPKKTLGTQYGYFFDTFDAHSETTETSVWDYTILNANSEFVHGEIEVEFLANVPGTSTNSTKVLNFKLEGTTVGQISWAAGTTGTMHWIIRLSGSTSTTCEYTIFQNSNGTLTETFGTITVSGDIAMSVTVTLGSASDVINVRRKSVRQISGEVTYT